MPHRCFAASARGRKAARPDVAFVLRKILRGITATCDGVKAVAAAFQPPPGNPAPPTCFRKSSA